MISCAALLSALPFLIFIKSAALKKNNIKLKKIKALAFSGLFISTKFMEYLNLPMCFFSFS